MGTCAACCWWRPMPPDEPIWAQHLGDCPRLDAVLDFRVATDAYPDGLGEKHRIVTAPEFGCTEFEAKG